MPKVKNVAETEYTNGEIGNILPGDVVEVSAKHAEYLLSPECPGSFEAVAEEPKKKKAE